jgi:hypothetical protein
MSGNGGTRSKADIFSACLKVEQFPNLYETGLIMDGST